ncbi:fungal specific transcription factor domain-containing protein [Trichoderma breve]|uniref:Fungal specific transcription factor domain-containing protein n=1 Tax=Trichoderma breve TaxID=2034170 RepID=A0A9W9BG43_9HYPO|nr:fungal specific transcription factor domain-containing protein [Trichoderma breve]KAJ4859258.1 fungal specific transcription factor domain-containing protein [Trichoderma breve]
MGSKQFSFVNISHPEESRSRHNLAYIRRHVMADVGRSKRKKPRFKIIPLEVASSGDASEAKPVKIEAAESPPLGRMPPSFQLHLVDTNARACELISFMAAEADYVYRPFRTSWVQIGLSDPTAFDLWLAQAIVIRGRTVPEDITSCPDVEYLSNPEANKYYSRSLTQLSHRLSSREECVSIGVVAIIMGFICIDTRVGNWDRYLMHMNGLERIYHLRNGFDELDREISLMAFFVDLMGASMLDRYPRFPIPKHCVNPSEMNYDSDMSNTLQILLNDARTIAPQGERIYAMLRVTASVIAMVNRNANDPLFWTHDAALAEKLGSASHFILSAPKSPEDDPHTNYPVFVVQRMVQLACLMVMSKLKQLASFHWADIDPLGDRLGKLLQVPCYEVPVQLQKLRLWAIVTACSLLDPEAQVPFLIELRRSIRALGYRTAEEAIEYVKNLLWLENVDIIATESLYGCCNL